jgi:YHS domain-containing protein
MKTHITLASLVAALCLSFWASAQEPAVQEASAPTAEEIQASIDTQLPSYPGMACPISGEPLGGEMGEPINHVVEGRLVRLCCKGCVKGVAKDPAAAFAKIDAAVIAEQSAGYPLDKCLISDEPFATAGMHQFVFGTRLVRTCCKDCEASFRKNPAGYMQQLDNAYIAAQIPTYAMATCPVSGEALGSMGDPVDLLYGTRLVRLCCKGCVRTFKKNPAETLAKLDAAAAETK